MAELPRLARRWIARVLGAVALVACGSALALDVTVSHVNPPGEATFEAFQRMGESLARSGRGLRLRMFPRGQLGDEKDIIEQVRLGALGIGAVSTASLSAFAPSAGVLDIPFLIRDQERHPWAVSDGPVGARIAQSIQQECGLVVLGWWSAGMRHVFTRDRPVRTAADLAALKIRVIGSPVYMDTFNTLGAKATPMPYGEVYTALATGTVDGAENDMTGYRNMKFYEQAPKLSLTGHFFLFKVLVTTHGFLAKMSADQRRAFDEAFAGATRFQREYSVSKFHEDLAWLAGNARVEVARPDRAQLEAAVRPVQAKYAQRFGHDLVEAIRAAQ